MEDQTEVDSPAIAAGWNPDPYRRHELRYWDGTAWTEHISDHGTTGVDATETASPWAAMTQSAAPAEPRAATQPAARVGTALGASSAPGSVGAPARPPGPSWGWDPPTPAAAPTSPPATPWGAPVPVRPPGALPFDPSSFDASQGKGAHWYKGKVGRLILVGILALVLAVGGYGWLHRPHRIDADPPAATPAGYRLVTGSEYQFAVPQAWISRAVTSDDRDQVAAFLDDKAPGTGDKFRDSSDHLDGTQIVAGDASGADNVNVVPFEALSGDPRDSDTLEEIRTGFTSEQIGFTTTGLTVVPADVHGFPAATASYTLTVAGRVVAQVSTVIQTGDHVYQLTVTSLSPTQAGALSAQILPTFNPV